MNTTVDRFVRALSSVERDGNLDEMVALFSDDAELSNTASPRVYRGREGAREFWHAYRATFGAVRSSFRSVVAADGRACLEWTTAATAEGHSELHYDGVSVLELSGDRIRRFRAYFDPRTLGRQIENQTPRGQRSTERSSLPA